MHEVVYYLEVDLISFMCNTNRLYIIVTLYVYNNRTIFFTQRDRKISHSGDKIKYLNTQLIQ